MSDRKAVPKRTPMPTRAATAMAMALLLTPVAAAASEQAATPAKPPPVQPRPGGVVLLPPARTAQAPAPRPAALPDKAAEPGKPPERAKWTDVAQAISAITVMLFTAFLAWLSWRQHNLEQRLARDTADSIAIARQSADAAASLARTTKEASEKQLRAYVQPVLTTFNINRVPEEHQPGVLVQFAAQLQNTGNTPARSLMAGAHIASLPWPHTGEMAGPGHLDPFVAVAAHASNPATFTQLLRFDRAGIVAGTERPYIRIRVEYEDVFGSAWASDFHWSVPNLAELLDLMDRRGAGTATTSAVMLTDRCSMT